MWAHGGMEVEEDGHDKTPSTSRSSWKPSRPSRSIWKDAYDETGLSWDDSANNRAFLSDQLSGTLNGSSIYLAAVKAKAGESTLDYEVQVEPDDIWHAGFPEGPAVWFNALGSRSMAAMSYSANTDVAVEFLQHFFSRDVFIPWLEAQGGYIIPMAPGYADLEIYTGTPTLAPYPAVSEYSRAKGYAGPSNQKAAETAARYVIVETIATAIQSGDAAGAVQQAEAQLQRIYGAYRFHYGLAAPKTGQPRSIPNVRCRDPGRRIFAPEQPMSVITAETRHGREIVQQPRGKARFWEREAPLAYLFMIPGLIILRPVHGLPVFPRYLPLADRQDGRVRRL